MVKTQYIIKKVNNKYTYYYFIRKHLKNKKKKVKLIFYKIKNQITNIFTNLLKDEPFDYHMSIHTWNDIYWLSLKRKFTAINSEGIFPGLKVFGTIIFFVLLNSGLSPSINFLYSYGYICCNELILKGQE